MQEEPTCYFVETELLTSICDFLSLQSKVQRNAVCDLVRNAIQTQNPTSFIITIDDLDIIEQLYEVSSSLRTWSIVDNHSYRSLLWHNYLVNQSSD
jgi:hypothetical protein